MGINSNLMPVPYGLMELDEAGTVIYYRPENSGPDMKVVGRNFFTDIAAVAETIEFQNRIKEFRRSHAPAMSFDFTFYFKNNSLSVRVLLARIHERSTIGGPESVETVFVHIRPQSERVAA